MAVRPRLPRLATMKNVPHTVTDAAIATIRERIETSDYPVGSLLPAQRQLSEELSISRASLREALSTLEALGMLHDPSGQGCVCEERAGEQLARVAFRGSGVAAGHLPDALRAGRVCRAAGGACDRRRRYRWLEDNLDSLQGALTSAELDEAAQLDFAFHMRIVSLAGNAAIESILRSSADIMKESQRCRFIGANWCCRRTHEHRRLSTRSRRAIGGRRATRSKRTS